MNPVPRVLESSANEREYAWLLRCIHGNLVSTQMVLVTVRMQIGTRLSCLGLLGVVGASSNTLLACKACRPAR